MRQKIGPFYVIGDNILAHGIFVDEGERYGDFITTSYSHISFWDETLSKKIKNVDFDYFPRGRVVYSEKSDLFIIYVDKDIDGNQMIDIKEAFGITEKRCKIETDEHYQCHLCNKEYIL